MTQKEQRQLASRLLNRRLIEAHDRWRDSLAKQGTAEAAQFALQKQAQEDAVLITELRARLDESRAANEYHKTKLAEAEKQAETVRALWEIDIEEIDALREDRDEVRQVIRAFLETQQKENQC